MVPTPAQSEAIKKALTPEVMRRLQTTQEWLDWLETILGEVLLPRL
jgi:hypothetical protein